MEACRNNTQAAIILGGDFNADGINWDTYSILPDCKKKSICEKIIDIFYKCGLSQLQTAPTRKGATLDLFATNKPGLVKNINNILGIADHTTLLIDSEIQARSSKKPPRNVFKWSQGNWDELHKDTAEFAQKYLIEENTRSLEENYAAIDQHLKSALKKHIPSRYTRTRMDLPWLTQDLKRECKRKQRLYNRAKKTGKPEHKKRFKESQKNVQRLLRQARWRYINRILQAGLDEGSSKPFRNYIRSQKQVHMRVSPLKKNGQLHPDSATKCDILADQFKSVFTTDANDTHRATKLYGPSYPQIPELIIQEEGVRKLLAGVNPSKASGPNEIPCRLLRELSDELAPVFTCLFKQTYSSGKLPSPWSAAWISPIFKRGTRSDASNYRPVSLTCVACKLFEHIFCSHIRARLDAHGILTPMNHGFRSKHSCESQLLITSHDIYQRLDRREQIDIGVLDFSKAFDTVPHRRLISKLEFCGISGPIRNWIRAFLTSRTQRVMMDGCHSREDAVDSGVPQGTVLGPLLFLIYIRPA